MDIRLFSSEHSLRDVYLIDALVGDGVIRDEVIGGVGFKISDNSNNNYGKEA